MTSRAKKTKKTGTKRRAARPILLRMTGYSALALALVAGWMSLRSLRMDAEGLDGPYDRITIQSQTLGRTQLFHSLKKTGSRPSEAEGVTRALGHVLNLRRLQIKDHYQVVRSTLGAFRHFTLRHGLKRYVVSRRNGRYRAKAWDITIITRTRRVSGVIKNSLWLSMQSHGVPANVIAEYADAFRWTIDFLTEPRGGDEFTVIWEERETYDGIMLSRVVQAALYDGQVTSHHVGIRFQREFYDEKGDSLQRMFLRAPLNFRRISSSFSRRRYHPILRRYRAHHGTDYSAPRGTPIISVGAGTVIHAGRKGGYGNAVKIRHSSTYSTLYGHMKRIARGVRKGRKVRQGQVIGFVGSSGLATGPHLHFEIEKNGVPVNFIRLKLRVARRIPRAKKKAFKIRKDLMLAALRESVRSETGAAK